MAWLLDADASRPPADAELRRRVFAQRESPAQVEAFARDFFRCSIPAYRNSQSVPPVFRGEVRRRVGRLEEILVREDGPAEIGMWRSTAIRRPTAANGDDLLNGIITTITAGEASAVRYTPGEIPWIDLPDDPRAGRRPWPQRATGASGQCSGPPLLAAYRANPKPEYLRAGRRSWTIGR